MPELLLIALVIVSATIAWQQYRYLRIRREAAEDRQQLLHSGDVFHVLVFFRLHTADKLVETARRFTEAVVDGGAARLIYAGQSAFTVSSQQLGPRSWDGVLLLEYPSRPVFEMCRAAPGFTEARRLFAETYLHGMRRNRGVSSDFPLRLLRHRAKELLRGRWKLAPLQPSPQFATSSKYETWRARVNRLHAVHEVNRRGLVIYTLVKFSASGFENARHTFNGELLSRMAVLNHGLLHAGRSVALEEFARFDNVYIVYYPGARYYAELISSQYFHQIVDIDPQGDMIRLPTVPITHRLLARTAR